MTAVTLGAAEAESENSEITEEETPIFEAGFDLDYYSAYVDKNTVTTDRMVLQPCAWADLTCFEPFYFGFFVWQNWDVTDRRRGGDEGYKHALVETDYNVHIGAEAWATDDEEQSLTLEAGHEWYTYQGRKWSHGEDPDTREIYLKATYSNPIVDVYGRICWMYDDFGQVSESSARSGLYYEIGFNREFEIADSLTFGADWNVSFGDSQYLGYYYGDSSSGIGGTTFKIYLDYAITDWLTIGGTLAYTGVLNEDARDNYKADGAPHDFRDCLWGGFSLKTSF